MKLSTESAYGEKWAQHSNILGGMFIQETEKEGLEKHEEHQECMVYGSQRKRAFQNEECV